VPKPRRDSARNVLDELEAQSKQYALKATLLSNLLRQAEGFLAQMPGKFEAATPMNAQQESLSFEKAGQQWRLWLRYPDTEDLNGQLIDVAVTEAAVWVKAEAAKLLPSLYEIITRELGEKLSNVEAGLDCLRQLPFLDFTAAENEDDYDSYDDVTSENRGGISDNEIPF